MVSEKKAALKCVEVVHGQCYPHMMQFPTTQWTLLAKASLNGDTSARSSLEGLCVAYYGPAISFLRSRGYSEHDAQDFTQTFFAELLKSKAWKRADRLQGRFRTFLLSILLRVVGRERERDGAEKRGGGQWVASIDDLDTEGEIAASDSAADSSTFDREWALRLMEMTMTAVADSFSDKAMWAVLERFLPGAGESPSYDEAAAKLGVSVGAMKTHVHRVRQQFREELRSAVARTVGAAHEVDEELAYLHRVLSSPNC